MAINQHRGRRAVVLVELEDGSFFNGGVSQTPYDVLIDEDGVDTYIGKALPGTSQSSSTWQIFKLSESPNDFKRYADGDAGFVHNWTLRTTYTY
jgi:hypothetical protein